MASVPGANSRRKCAPFAPASVARELARRHRGVRRTVRFARICGPVRGRSADAAGLGQRGRRPEVPHRRHLEGDRRKGLCTRHPGSRHAALAAATGACARSARDQGRPPLCRLRSVGPCLRSRARPRRDGFGPQARRARFPELLRQGHAARRRRDAGLSRPSRRDPDLSGFCPLPLRQGQTAVRRRRHPLWRSHRAVAARSLGFVSIRARRRHDAPR